MLCLGDIIGYGPQPRETLLKVMDRAELSLLGNHEQGAMYYASDFNPRARAAIDWTRDQLNRRDRRLIGVLTTTFIYVVSTLAIFNTSCNVIGKRLIRSLITPSIRAGSVCQSQRGSSPA